MFSGWAVKFLCSSLLVCLTRVLVRGDPMCNDQAAGNEKDWVLIYKPTDSTQGQKVSSTATDAWAVIDLTADADPNLLRNIYDFLKDQGKSPFAIAYNGHPPRTPKPMRGQSKTSGLIAYEANKDAILLTHTMPQWPDFYLADKAAFLADLRANQKNAVFLCLSVPKDKISDWTEGIAYEDPYIYYWQFTEKAGHLEKIVKGTATASGVAIYKAFKTSGASPGEVKTFATKSSVDLYSSLMTVALKSNLTMWNIAGTGSDVVKKSCGTHFKVKYSNMDDFEVNAQKITRANDRTIWAYTSKGKTVCFSSSPRQVSERSAPRGAVCLKNDKVHQHFKQLAKKVDKCP